MDRPISAGRGGERPYAAPRSPPRQPEAPPTLSALGVILSPASRRDTGRAMSQDAGYCPRAVRLLRQARRRRGDQSGRRRRRGAARARRRFGRGGIRDLSPPLKLTPKQSKGPANERDWFNSALPPGSAVRCIGHCIGSPSVKQDGAPCQYSPKGVITQPGRHDVQSQRARWAVCVSAGSWSSGGS